MLIWLSAERDRPCVGGVLLFMENQEVEIWKEVFGYEGLYYISSHGKVKSTPRQGCLGGIRIPRTGRWGYDYIVVSKNNKNATKKIHRLVAETFIPNPENKPMVNHINGIKTDNRVTNLEWATAKENSQHAWEKGLSRPLKGEFNGVSKVTDNERLEIAHYYSTGLSQTLIAEKYNITQSNVSHIVRHVLRNLLSNNQAIKK